MLKVVGAVEDPMGLITEEEVEAVLAVLVRLVIPLLVALAVRPSLLQPLVMKID